VDAANVIYTLPDMGWKQQNKSCILRVLPEGRPSVV